MKAGVAVRDITPPVGSRLADHTRYSTGSHDPLFARALVLDDGKTAVAIVCLDLVIADFAFCDRVRERIAKSAGIDLSLINTTHSHSAPFGMGEPYVPFGQMDPPEAQWQTDTQQAIVDAAAEATARLQEVTLHVGRAPAQVGFNRRLFMPEHGCVTMEKNPDGPVVPWVNVLDIRGADGKHLAVLFEHACHPVIVHHTSSLTGTDYCGPAIARVTEGLGDGCTPLFAQGCGSNINGHPLFSGIEKANEAGRKLGDAALEAIAEAKPIQADKLRIASTRTDLPCQDPPTLEGIDRMRAKYDEASAGNTYGGEGYRDANLETFEILKGLSRRNEERSLRFDVNAVMLGDEWCLVAMPHEMFCQYELWVDEAAPFRSTMTFGYTNGCQSYVATDDALALGQQGGYEAGAYPFTWFAAARGYQIRLPLAVGAEKRIKKATASLWQ